MSSTGTLPVRVLQLKLSLSLPIQSSKPAQVRRGGCYCPQIFSREFSNG
jgi:hypothetical protein